MKKNLFTFILLIPFLGCAQQNQGTIVYETRSAGSMTMNGVTQTMPTRVSKNELLFSPTASLFRNIPNTDEDETFKNGGTALTMLSNNSLRMQYHDYTKKERLSTAELGGKEYIKQSGLPDLNWVLTDETKTILGHTCKKAKGSYVRKDWRTSVTSEPKAVTVTPIIDTVAVYAWFTAEIPLAIGPDRFTGLPGAVLMVENNKGKILYEAVSISQAVKQKDLQAPSKGKLISEEDFLKEDRDYREKSTRAMNGF
jgi:GLPGLI family protein